MMDRLEIAAKRKLNIIKRGENTLMSKKKTRNSYHNKSNLNPDSGAGRRKKKMKRR